MHLAPRRNKYKSLCDSPHNSAPSEMLQSSITVSLQAVRYRDVSGQTVVSFKFFKIMFGDCYGVELFGWFFKERNMLVQSCKNWIFFLQTYTLFTPPPPFKTFLHLFDHMIKPILLYYCGIWGTLTSRYRNRTNIYMISLKIEKRNTLELGNKYKNCYYLLINWDDVLCILQ